MLARLHARGRSPESLVKGKVGRDSADRFDAHALEFLSRTGVDWGQPPDVIFWSREIAAVKEFASYGIIAMASGSDVRRGWSGEDPSLKPDIPLMVIL